MSTTIVTTTPLQLPFALYSESAVASAAAAALAWHDHSVPREVALTRVMRALALARRANEGRPPAGANRPQEFIALFKEPLRSWIPQAQDQVLVEDGRSTTFCADVVAEFGTSPEAELVQRKVGDARATFAKRKRGDEEYTAFRSFLAKNGHARNEDAIRALVASGVPLLELFEEIPSTCRFKNGERGEVYCPCPRCTWPMMISGSVMQCSAAQCREVGARFTLDENGVAAPLGSKAAPQWISVVERLRLRYGAWRYTLLPGLEELSIAERVRRIAGTTVLLWPQRDQYDLHIEHGGREWRVDVKDWSDAGSLAASLQRHPHSAGPVCIVVPDRSVDQLPVLRERCTDTSYRFLSARQLIAEVKKASSKKVNE